MLIKTLAVGQLETNCYIVTDEGTLKCAVIDPGAESGAILDYIEANRLKVEAIFLTHGHFDHYMALDNLLAEIDAPVYINMLDVNTGGGRDRLKLSDNGKLSAYSEGDVINVGGLAFHVMHTPGHSPGSVTLKCSSALFTGDTLFSEDCGRTDLAGGDRNALMESLRRLASLDGDFEVYPGHAESTTLERERSFNICLRQIFGGA